MACGLQCLGGGSVMLANLKAWEASTVVERRPVWSRVYRPEAAYLIWLTWFFREKDLHLALGDFTQKCKFQARPQSWEAACSQKSAYSSLLPSVPASFQHLIVLCWSFLGPRRLPLAWRQYPGLWSQVQSQFLYLALSDFHCPASIFLLVQMRPGPSQPE